MKKTVHRIIHGMICVVVISTLSLPLLAITPHEDPEKAEIIYDGISLFKYYSEILDSVLAGKPEEVRIKIERMPLANLPENLRTTTGDLTSSIQNISLLLVDIDRNIIELNSLIRQHRFTEAVPLSVTVKESITSAAITVHQINDSIVVTGNTFNVFSAPAESTLRVAYDEVIERINIIRQLLEAYLKMLSGVINTESGIAYVDDATILKSLIPIDITLIIELMTGFSGENFTVLESLIPTDVTLFVEPTIVFVGDDITISGALKSEDGPLEQRQVYIFVNNTQYLTVKTDTNGQYQAVLAIPYKYSSEINVRALYYPQGEDIGVYLSSLSPELTLSVLFYSADMVIRVTPKAYPGMKTTISGSFDYGSFPPPVQREIEVYLDNVLVVKTEASDEFSLMINLNAETTIGKHAITLSASGMKRYAPVIANAVLNVTKAVPVLTMNFPRVVIIPGKIELAGKLESEVGQLKNANIAVDLDKTSMVVKSSDEGTFETSMKMKMGFGLVGSESLVIQITPEEPWHDVLTVSRKVLMVNIVNCVIFLVVVIFSGILLSRKLRVAIQIYGRRRLKPVSIPVTNQEFTPTYSETIVPKISQASVKKEEVEPRFRIYSWYISLLIIIQKATSVFLTPNQTLREFAAATNKALGPLAGYFMAFTRLIERLLYSRHEATDSEVEQSRQISNTIEQGLKS